MGPSENWMPSHESFQHWLPRPSEERVCVLDVAVGVAIAVAIAPLERREDPIPSGAHEVVVAAEAPVLRQQDQPQRRGVRRSVVRAVRLLADDRELAVADLVQDPARLLVAEVVHLRALQLTQQMQRAAGEVGADPERLQGRDQRVAAEERHEPRKPGGRQHVRLAVELPSIRSAARSTIDLSKTALSTAVSDSNSGAASSQRVSAPSEASAGRRSRRASARARRRSARARRAQPLRTAA